MTENTPDPNPELSLREYLTYLPGGMIGGFLLALTIYASLWTFLSMGFSRTAADWPLVKTVAFGGAGVLFVVVFIVISVLVSVWAYLDDKGLMEANDD